MGDPAGIGPEVIVKAAQQLQGRRNFPPLLVAGDLAALSEAAASAGVELRPQAWQPGEPLPPSGLAVLQSSHLEPAQRTPGKPTLEGAAAAYGYIRAAAAMAVAGEAAGLVTAPISKEWLNRAGYHFPGHTELLAEMAGVSRFRMMFASGRLRLALVTVHIGLAEVPARLNPELVFDTIDLLAEHLRAECGLSRPRVAVLGLNPHAGEGGLFGREEIDAIQPAIARAQKLGIEAIGPLPPDTAFVREAGRFRFDGAVAMYHDQGLIPIKMLDFDRAVNVTLGLPWVRTSPDHGTGYDIAGLGRARAASMLAAIRFAAQAAARRGRAPRAAMV